MQNKQIIYKDLGLLPYDKAWEIQEQLFDEIIQIKVANRSKLQEDKAITPNYLLFVEHPHVYTLGKSGVASHLLASEEFLKKIDAQYYKTNRGGDITYHGPGQMVAYPLLDLDNFFTDIHKYLRFLEEVIILLLADYGIIASRSKGETGVWIDVDTPDARKICAMGVRASRWVTMHGLALNVTTDMNYFEYIIPCGIRDKKVTSMEKELGRAISMQEVKTKFMQYFAQLFEVTYDFQ